MTFAIALGSAVLAATSLVLHAVMLKSHNKTLAKVTELVDAAVAKLK